MTRAPVSHAIFGSGVYFRAQTDNHVELARVEHPPAAFFTRVSPFRVNLVAGGKDIAAFLALIHIYLLPR